MPWRLFRAKPTPDLEDQYETLLDAVWQNEREQDYQRRIDNAAYIQEQRDERARRKADGDHS